MEVYLIRHTTPHIEKDVCYGQSDISLADTFEVEWQAIREILPQKIDVIFSSPLSRCRQLTIKLANHFGISFIEDARLKEMNFGEWELKRWNEIDQTKLRHWMENYKTERCPDGESYEDVIGRVKSFINDQLISARQRILLVTHAGIINGFDAIMNQQGGIDLKVGYGEIHIYKYP